MKKMERRKIENKIIEKNARFHILNTNVTHVNWDVVLVRKSVSQAGVEGRRVTEGKSCVIRHMQSRVVSFYQRKKETETG